MEVLSLFAYIIPTFVIIFAITFIWFVARHKGKNQTRSLSVQEDYDLKEIDIARIDRMEDGSEFEMYLYRLFLELGYQGVYKTVGARDFGADVVFTDREGVRNVVQAKRYTDSVGISAVQEVFSCMRYYKAKKAIVIASAKFTEPSETLAGINHVKLLDRDDLISIIEAFKKDDIQAVKDRIEAEPRMILESWREANSPVLHEIKKDYKAEQYVKKAMGK
ncbi:restriction endonuclease [Paenibacillus sepulcri]|uniref:Restriction endonuclease n=1 Tax=Paenibacillus sepulcri TaxID=359917 RepID=A0ABS7C5B9_9BACL|nr:restriction endonuclease [Paenibacillus sepulcri]